jgi:GNAT superfamily N-acetyltransferase
MPAPEPRLPLTTVMTSRDARQIFALIREAADGQRRGMPPGVSSVEDLAAVMRGGVAFFVAYKNAAGSPDLEPVGAIGYRWERGTLRVFHVAVKASERRSGVARRMLEAVEAVGLALGTKSVSLTVDADPTQRALFENAGYNPASGPATAGRVQLRKAFNERLV